MYKLNKIRGFVALPIIIGGAILAVGVLGGLAYEYKNDKSILSSINKNNLLAQAYGGTTPTITVTSPNGGEQWKVGETRRITWSALGVNYVKLGIRDSTISGSGSVNYLGDGSAISADLGYFDWTIIQNQLPGSDSLPRNYTIVISGHNNALDYDSIVTDTSDNLFTISVPPSTITVTSPNGGEGFKVDDPIHVAWVPASLGVTAIYYIPADNSTFYSGDYGRIIFGSWDSTIPSIPAGQYKIRIYGADKSQDDSDGYFTISSVPTQASIKILSPNGGETYRTGDTAQIRWNGSMQQIVLTPVNSDGSLNYQNSSLIVSHYNTADYSGLYSWVIPSTVTAGKYYIQVEGCCGETGGFDNGDSYFTVTAPQSTCTPATSCILQYCQYGGDLKKCTVNKTDCSTSTYTTGGCKSAPSISTVCDSTAKAIVDTVVGGCAKIDRSLYSNIYDVCCVPVVVTEQSLLSMLNTALADRFIDKQEATALLIALDSYLGQ